MLAALIGGVPAIAAGAAPRQEIPEIPGIQGAEVVQSVPTAAPSVPPNPEGSIDVLDEAVRPEAEVAEVEVEEDPVAAGDTPISVSAPEGAPDDLVPAAVTVEVLDEHVASDVDASGFTFTLDRADEVDENGEVNVTVDYSAFAEAFGAGFSDRLVIKEYPACVLDRPEDADCNQGTVLRAVNDPDAQTLSTDLEAEAAPPVEEEPPAGDTTTTTTTTTTTVPDTTTTTVPGDEPTSTTVPDATTTTAAPVPGGGEANGGVRPFGSKSLAGLASDGNVYAVTSGVAGGAGNFGVTSLSTGQRWVAGGSSGSFNWSYPIDLPAGSVGTPPSLSLDYSSGAVDAMTPGANSQPGEVGLGWSLGGLGFIERKYRTCAQDGTGWINADLCWHSNNASISFGGNASELVPTDTPGMWRLEDDPGWRVEHRFDGQNADNNDEYWVVTATDGTQYWFGYGAEQDSNMATNSAWTVPVFGNSSGEPCYDPDVDSAWCSQAWRWNLDRIVDPDGNLTTVFWTPETNRYGRQGYPNRSTSYTRGGMPARIDYSMQSGTQNPPVSVIFAGADRCVGSWADPVQSCPPMTQANASDFPDVPVDLVCTSTTYCDDYAPSFFTQKRLTEIYAYTFSSTLARYETVDKWVLKQTMPTTPDGSESKLWLDRIQRVGNPAFFGMTGVDLEDRPIDFDAVWLGNRADYNTNLGVGPSKMPRINLVREELGAETTVVYGQPNHPCSDKDGPWDDNTQYCFPVYFKPDGQPAGWAVANKYVVTSVAVSDPITGSATQTSTYTYGDAPGWHHNDDPVLPDSGKTWSDYRGHSKVQVVQGSSRTSYLYLRGMHGDKNVGGTTKSVSITTSNGIAATDSDWLAGRLREQRTFRTDGVELTGSVHSYLVDSTTGTDELGNRARMVLENKVETRSYVSSTETLETEVTTSYNDTGQPTQVYDRGDLAEPDDDRCTKTTYYANTSKWILDKPARVKVDANCAAPYNRVTDYRYDGSTSTSTPPSVGHPTKVIRYNASVLDDSPQGAVATSMAYDAHGRLISTTTAENRVTSVTYSPSNSGLTRTVTTTDALNRSTVATLEQRRLNAVTVTDWNGRTTSSSYDELGRATWRALPGETSANPSYKYAYGESHYGQSWYREERRTTGTTYLKQWTYVDALGRTLETQTAPASGSGRMTTFTTYDDRGLVARSSAPFVATGTAGSGRVNVDSAPNYSINLYDELGRTTSVWAMHNSTFVSAATTSYKGLMKTETSPEGRKRSFVTNTLGDLTQVIQRYESGTEYASTEYRYTVDHLLTGITDDAGNVTTHAYDNMGRRTATADPDAGYWQYFYDDDGLQTRVVDAKGVSTFTAYNAVGQPDSRHRGISPSDPMIADWAYWDTAGKKGLLQSETTFDPTGAWVSSVTDYDALARPTAWSLSVPTGAGPGLGGTYSWSATYDALGSETSVSYPAIADLPAEVITQGYSSTERPTTLSSPLATYVSATTFRGDGLLAARAYGTDANAPIRLYGYDANTLRLSVIAAAFAGGGATFQNDQLAYDLDGNVASITDLATGGASQKQCFRNDMQSRLYEAWTTDGTATCTQAADANLAVGPSPYRQVWTHDTIDNITKVVTTNGGVTSTTDFTYAQTGNAGPHAVTTTTWGSLTGTFEYDANGSLSSKALKVGTTNITSQSLTWDDDRNLANVAVTNGTSAAVDTTSTYLANGERVLRKTPDGKTVLYLRGHEITGSVNGSTARRNYTAAGVPVATRTAAGLWWLLNDQQGTTQIAVQAGTSTASRQRYLPYGGVRGSANQLPTDDDFLGKTKDDTTGLIDVGARYYDPDRGQFLSPDVLGSAAMPELTRPYNYSALSPVSFSDPSGLISIDALLNQLKRVGGSATINRSGHLDWRVSSKRVSIFRQRQGSLGGRSHLFRPSGGGSALSRRGTFAPRLGVDPAVDNYLNENYKVNGQIPNGTGGALEWELENKARFRSDSGHLIKAREQITWIRGNLRSGKISAVNRAPMLDELNYLSRLVNEADSAARAAGIDDLASEMRSWPRVDSIATPPAPPPGGDGLAERIAGAVARRYPLLMAPIPSELVDNCSYIEDQCYMTS